MKRRRREHEAEGEPAKRPAAAEGRPPPLRAACRGEYVHPALRCTAVRRKGFGCVTSAKLRAGELLLVARGLRFSSASAEPGRRDGGLFLAEALQQLGALVHGDAADATALLGSWRGLCPREPSVALRAPLLAQTATLTELLALHGANCGVRGIDDLVDLVLKIECNAFAGGLFPLAACLNHSCRPNVAVTLRRAKSLGPGGEESETSTHETRALRDIGAGEELCIHYLGLAAQHRGRWERRHVLSNGPRGFICCCAGCASCAGDAAGSMRCTHGARDESDGDSTAAAAAAAAARPIEWLETLANRERRDISSDGWCTQTALDRWAACGRCCSKGRTCRPAATAADLRVCERALQAAPSADDLHAPRWGLAEAMKLVEEATHPRHWLRFTLWEALAERSQAAALMLRHVDSHNTHEGGGRGSPARLGAGYWEAVAAHVLACRGALRWAEATQCYATHERGMCRLQERLGAALLRASAQTGVNDSAARLAKDCTEGQALEAQARASMDLVYGGIKCDDLWQSAW